MPNAEASRAESDGQEQIDITDEGFELYVGNVPEGATKVSTATRRISRFLADHSPCGSLAPHSIDMFEHSG